MTYKAPGKFEREGITIMEIMDMFPNEESARKWFESIIWPKGRHCPKCGSTKTCESKHVKMPYWCGECRSYFSVKTGTAIANSKIPLRKWCLAIYLCLTSLKSVSSMKLHRDIGVSQPTAWFMMHRIREAWAAEDNDPFDGPVEFDETYVGGKKANMTLARKTELTGRGVVGKTAVVGAKDRKTNQVNAKVVKDTKKKTIHEFVKGNAKPDATVYTDEHRSYKGIPQKHETVNHSVDQYVDGPIHVNGIESFWSMFKRAQKGTFHKMSPKHLQRYINEFSGKHNIRNSGTLEQMQYLAAHLVGRNLLRRTLVADNGLSSGARSS